MAISYRVVACGNAGKKWKPFRETLHLSRQQHLTREGKPTWKIPKILPKDVCTGRHGPKIKIGSENKFLIHKN